MQRILRVILVGLTLAAQPGFAAGDGPPTPLAAAFEAMRAGDWAKVEELSRQSGKLTQDVIEWQRLRGSKEGSFDEYRDFLNRRSDWPGLALLRQRGEATIPVDADPKVVRAYFAGHSPRTGTGILRLAEADFTLGKDAEAKALVIRAWRSFSLTKEERAAFLDGYAKLLAPHHIARMDMLLWRGLAPEVEAMLPLVPPGWQALAKARIALRKNRNGVDALINAVPADLSADPGLAYERFVWRARKGRNADAISLLVEQSTSPEALGSPRRWSGWRRALARAEMRQGRYRQAYELAARHQLTDGSAYADLEWLSGYLALRFLNQPELALDHFTRFRATVSTPISLGRAEYWLGRALEAMGDPQAAKSAYAEGAKYQTSFYGLLAAEKAGAGMLPALAGTESFPSWKDAAFMKSSVLQAALLLQKAGERRRAQSFVSHLAAPMSRQEMGQLSQFALSIGEDYMAVMIGKQAAAKGYILPEAYYAVHPLAEGDLPVDTELALAIARRESEFNPGVVSSVGARGMMQVMPKTAEAVAKRLAVDYSSDRLLSDWAYNVRIGSTYLAELEQEFGGNHVLVAAAYNAGPSRVRRWIEDQGDPRSGTIDVVDWIEHIPFRETRNYVMRVMESLPVYRARIVGKPVKITLSRELEAN